MPPLAEEDGVELFTARARAVASGLHPERRVTRSSASGSTTCHSRSSSRRRACASSAPSSCSSVSATALDLLKAGRGVDPRQQTLRATIEWSYDLLTEDERRIFARLAVFRGGCTLEAAEEVADADLDTIQSLVDKSLLRHDARSATGCSRRSASSRPSGSRSQARQRSCGGGTPTSSSHWPPRRSRTCARSPRNGSTASSASRTTSALRSTGSRRWARARSSSSSRRPCGGRGRCEARLRKAAAAWRARSRVTCGRLALAPAHSSGRSNSPSTTVTT